MQSAGCSESWRVRMKADAQRQRASEREVVFVGERERGGREKGREKGREAEGRRLEIGGRDTCHPGRG